MAGKLYSNRELGRQIGLLATRQDDCGLDDSAELAKVLSSNERLLSHSRNRQPPSAKRQAPNAKRQTLTTNRMRDVRFDHFGRIDDAIKLVFRYKAEFQCGILQREIVVHCVVRDL